MSYARKQKWMFILNTVYIVLSGERCSKQSVKPQIQKFSALT